MATRAEEAESADSTTSELTYYYADAGRPALGPCTLAQLSVQTIGGGASRRGVCGEGIRDRRGQGGELGMASILW